MLERVSNRGRKNIRTSYIRNGRGYQITYMKPFFSRSDIYFQNHNIEKLTVSPSEKHHETILNIFWKNVISILKSWFQIWNHDFKFPRNFIFVPILCQFKCWISLKSKFSNLKAAGECTCGKNAFGIEFIWEMILFHKRTNKSTHLGDAWIIRKSEERHLLRTRSISPKTGFKNGHFCPKMKLATIWFPYMGIFTCRYRHEKFG